MLDVHVPHPTHTWKDFFIHIATNDACKPGLFGDVPLQFFVDERTFSSASLRRSSSSWMRS